MHKIIAKTIKGSEYIYSRHDCFSVNPKKAMAVCNALNNHSWNLKDNELWHIYTIPDIDFRYCNAVFQQFQAGKKGIKITYKYSVYPGARGSF